jgi:NhaP-type Na+/H+ or K+/H+ antiporter
MLSVPAIMIAAPLACNERTIAIALNYAAVVFSIPVQGLSIGKMAPRLMPCSR